MHRARTRALKRTCVHIHNHKLVRINTYIIYTRTHAEKPHTRMHASIEPRVPNLSQQLFLLQANTTARRCSTNTTDGRTDGKTHLQKDGQTNRQTTIQTHCYIDTRTDNTACDARGCSFIISRENDAGLQVALADVVELEGWA